MMLMDGTVNKQEEVLRGAYSVLGAKIPLVGGCAGDSLGMNKTFLFHNDRVLTDAIVAVALSSDGTFGIGVQHGWTTIGEPLLASRTTDGRVEELNDPSRLDLYLRMLDAPRRPTTSGPPSIGSPWCTRWRCAAAPGTRCGSSAAPTSRAAPLVCMAEVPQSSLLWLTEGDAESMLDSADEACLTALAALNSATPLGLLAFDCIARRSVLGDEGIPAGGRPGDQARGRGTDGGPLHPRGDRPGARVQRFPQPDPGCPGDELTH
jgi:hypothetical protein